MTVTLGGKVPKNLWVSDYVGSTLKAAAVSSKKTVDGYLRHVLGLGDQGNPRKRGRPVGASYTFMAGLRIGQTVVLPWRPMQKQAHFGSGPEGYKANVMTARRFAQKNGYRLELWARPEGLRVTRTK